MNVLIALLLASGVVGAKAQEARFYDPSNAASPTGRTTGYELYRTIGCPGQELLGTPCPEPAVVKPAPVVAAPAPKDSDGDGVPDDKDRCPNTPAGARVDAQGCELDSDGDGVVDRLDQCPTTPKGDKVDVRGCTLASTIQLKRVNFDTDSAAIRADARAILDEAVATLKRYPHIHVEVAGHTDSRADDAYNQALSQRRARAVVDYFIQQGIEAGRLTAKGYGEAQPIADNATAKGRASNRRVELRILP